MVIVDNYRAVLQKYAVFSGRATRSEYWYFGLVNFVIAMLLYYVLGQIGHLLYVIYTLGVLIHIIAVSTRRLHDTNHSAWWFFILLVPFVGSIVWIIFMVTDSTAANQYGPNPKGVTAPAPEVPPTQAPIA
jgi:uncharacterized membrane protein YhaH (DUF805 family)